MDNKLKYILNKLLSKLKKKPKTYDYRIHTLDGCEIFCNILIIETNNCKRILLEEIDDGY